MNIPLTPLRCLRYAEQQYPRRTAVVCSDLRFTYAQFAERAARLAGALRAGGVKPGDRVAFLSMNCHRLLEAYYGVLDAGAVLLPLNIRLAPHELAFILNDAGAKVLFLEKEFLSTVDSFRQSLSTVETLYLLDGAPQADWLAPKNYDELLAAASLHRTDIMEVDENAVCELFYTSGTSATPKGVMLTHRNTYMHALYACLIDDPTAESVQLHTIPLFHANGWGTPHSLALTGGKHVMIQRFETARIFRLIEQERVRTMCLVPAMATALVNCPERTKYDLSSLRIINVGGAASSPTLVREVEEKLGASCRSGYGLTETSPILSISRMKPGLDWQGEQKYIGQAMTGFAIAGVELRVVDANDKDVPHDGQSIGEVVARSDVVMEGYWGQPQATEEAMRGGWFHTGDMATINNDGYILVVDRKKEIIVSGGENISSLEVEKALLAHPTVYEVAVVAVPDAKWGEVPKALVVLKPGSQATEAELLEFCRARIAHYKAPRSVEFFASLPKTGTGKILKRELRKKYWGGQDTIRPEFASRK
ncbi:MAG: long-chain-fatty-acid--CoA ligase [Candidatus Acidiferrales bacterium]